MIIKFFFSNFHSLFVLIRKQKQNFQYETREISFLAPRSNSRMQIFTNIIINEIQISQFNYCRDICCVEFDEKQNQMMMMMQRILILLPFLTRIIQTSVKDRS